MVHKDAIFISTHKFVGGVQTPGTALKLCLINNCNDDFCLSPLVLKRHGNKGHHTIFLAIAAVAYTFSIFHPTLFPFSTVQLCFVLPVSPAAYESNILTQIIIIHEIIHVTIIVQVIIIYVITNIIYELYNDNNESSLTKVFYKHTHEIIIV